MAGRTLARHAAQIAAAGKTTVQEAMRVANQSED
jgi:hypothetical protein